MTPLEMIAEWRKGCSCASEGHPEECHECTVSLIEALELELPKWKKSYSEGGEDGNSGAAAELRAKEAEEKLKVNQKLLTALYNNGYEAGHNDTIEGCYTNVLPVDADTYHSDLVDGWLSERQDEFNKEAEESLTIAYMKGVEDGKARSAGKVAEAVRECERLVAEYCCCRSRYRIIERFPQYFEEGK